MSEPEYIAVTRQIPIADVDGVPIREGSVLRHIKDGEQGVVVWIGREGEPCRHMMAAVGDLAICQGPGLTRISNQYAMWKHVSRDAQTYKQRLLSWQYQPFEAAPDRSISPDMQVAIDGIMALLPIEIVDWERGPWPDTLDDALRFLAEHLTTVSESPCQPGE